MNATNVAVCNFDPEDEWGGLSNHCHIEWYLWWAGQGVLFIAYIFGWLGTQYGLHRYKYMPVFRGLASLAFVTIAVWAFAFGESLEQGMFAVVLAIVNLLFFMYYIMFDKSIQVNGYLHNLWTKMFNGYAGYNLEQLDFYHLMEEKAYLKTYKCGQVYIHEHDSPHQLSILLSGRMKLTKHDGFQRKNHYVGNRTTHAERALQSEKGDTAYCGSIYPYEFIDSPEWLAAQGTAIQAGHGHEHHVHHHSQVSIIADHPEVDCVVLTWKREVLEAVFKERPRLRTCIHALVGKDIASKLLRITGHSPIGKEVEAEGDLVRRLHGYCGCSFKADVKNQTDGHAKKVLQIPANNAADILDQKYIHKIYDEDEGKYHEIEVDNLDKYQKKIREKLGVGPWCDLPEEELKKEPWTCRKYDSDDDEREPLHDDEHGEIPDDPSHPFYFAVEQAKISLQKARLRVANSRLLGMNPGVLESLQPANSVQEQNPFLKTDLLQFFEDNVPTLKKKDLAEILKWGKWRTYYRPETTVQRQGEEAVCIGIVLQGKLDVFTEDEITRSRSYVTSLEQYDLYGAEDFSSKFRTARRTVMMPAFLKTNSDDAPQRLQRETAHTETYDPMYYMLELRQAEKKLKKARKMAKHHDSDSESDSSDSNSTSDSDDSDTETNTNTDSVSLVGKDRCLDAEDRDALYSAIKQANNLDQKEVLFTAIPTVLFVWEIKDLKRLMLADPHVESALSHLLRSDISYRLQVANPDSLGTRTCGVVTQARGDQDPRICNVQPQ